jgi:hypothetical protein
VQTLSALEGSHSALSNIFMNQASVYASKPAADKQVLPATLLADHTYKTVYMLIKARLSRKGERDPTLDPQRQGYVRRRRAAKHHQLPDEQGHC